MLLPAALRLRGCACGLCLRLPRGCGVRGWGRDGLGTGAQGRGREGAQSVDVDYAPELPGAHVGRAACPTGPSDKSSTPSLLTQASGGTLVFAGHPCKGA